MFHIQQVEASLQGVITDIDIMRLSAGGGLYKPTYNNYIQIVQLSHDCRELTNTFNTETSIGFTVGDL